jgi:long-chain acyl-CoA synthetase
MNEQAIYTQLKEDFLINENLMFAGKLLQRACKKYPNQIALIAKDKSISYQELFFRATQLSEKIKQLGVHPQDRVLLYCENSLNFYVAYWAILQCAAVAVPLNIYLHEKELNHIINDAEPKLILASSQFQSNIKNTSQTTMCIQDMVDWHTQVPEQFGKITAEILLPELENNQMCLLLYTSGTTGLPKGVMLSSKNILTNGLQSCARFKMCKLQKNERFFCVLPLFHVFAQNVCIWVPAMTGSSVIVVEKIDRKLIIAGLKHEPTLFLGVPALYGLLCLMKTAPLDSVKLFVSGADMLSDKIRSAFSMIYGRKIASGYGLTEASPLISVNYKNHEEPTDIVSPLVADLVCEIRNDEGIKLARNQTGTLWVKGDNVMLGYYKSPDATAQVLCSGWLCTGDLGCIDHKGNLAIKGRLKDVIIHKGFNIYPAEIENILLTHPGVFKAAVIGQEERTGGQIPVAYLAIKNREDREDIDKKLDQELRALCAHNLATYKIPRKFVYLEDLPMNATGKIDKKQLRT